MGAALACASDTASDHEADQHNPDICMGHPTRLTSRRHQTAGVPHRCRTKSSVSVLRADMRCSPCRQMINTVVSTVFGTILAWLRVCPNCFPVINMMTILVRPSTPPVEVRLLARWGVFAALVWGP